MVLNQVEETTWRGDEYVNAGGKLDMLEGNVDLDTYATHTATGSVDDDSGLFAGLTCKLTECCGDNVLNLAQLSGSGLDRYNWRLHDHIDHWDEIGKHLLEPIGPTA